MKINTCNIVFIPVFIISFLFAINSSAENGETSENIYKRITAIQSDSLIKANEINPDFVILDVRTPEEWNSYHILESINRSTGLTDFTEQLDKLPKHKIFLLHCQSGGRSAGAFAKMKELRFAEVYEMIGGLNSWNNSKLPTTKIIEPKLMLVSYGEFSEGNYSDSIKITITNRANGKLTFQTVSFSDIHNLANNFDTEIILEGAQDYTFSIVHSPAYSEEESTKIWIESNGGNMDLNIEFKNGTIVGIDDHQISELSVYPNPANSMLFIKKDGFNRFDEITIFTISGQKIFSDNPFSDSNGINVSHLKNGIYIVRVQTGNQFITEKFIVKHE